MQSYYIAALEHFAGDFPTRRRLLLEAVGAAARAGIDYIQLGADGVTVRQLEQLAAEALEAIAGYGGRSRLLISGRTDVALAVGAAGVHLAARQLAASEARSVAAQAASRSSGRVAGEFLVVCGCGSAGELRLAEAHGADFALFGPVYEGSGAQPLGLEELRRSTAIGELPDLRVEAGDIRGHLQVFAQGGITLRRAAECAAAGACGVAAVRMFQESEELAALVAQLRRL